MYRPVNRQLLRPWALRSFATEAKVPIENPQKPVINHNNFKNSIKEIETASQEERFSLTLKLVKNFYSVAGPSETLVGYCSKSESEMLLRTLVKGGDYPYSKHLYQSLKHEKSHVPSLEFEQRLSLASLCDFHGDFGGVKEVLGDSFDSNVGLNEEEKLMLLNVYLSASLNSLQHIKCGEQIAENVEPLEYDSLFSYRAINRVLSAFKKENINLNGDSMHMLIAHFIHIKDYDVAVKMLKEFEGSVETFQDLSAFLLFQMIHESRLVAKPFAYLEWMFSAFSVERQPRLETLELVFSEYISLANVDYAEKLAEKCFSIGIIPNLYVLEGLLDLYLCHNNLEASYELLARMIEYEKPASSDAWFRFFMACLQSSSDLDTFEVYDENLSSIILKLKEDKIPPCVEIKYGLLRCMTRRKPSNSFIEIATSYLTDIGSSK